MQTEKTIRYRPAFAFFSNDIPNNVRERMHYYQFNIGDYSSHTRHLSLIEDAIYRRLLDLYYLHERPLNCGVSSVARQINARDYEAEVKIILEEFFSFTEDGWINSRADEEIEHYHSKIEQASKAGKASAEARAIRRSTDVLTDVQPNNKHKPINIKHKTLTSVESTRATRLPDNWQPTDAMVEFCKTERPDLKVKDIADQFRDYWIAQAGAKGRKVNWDATWRNWIRNQRIAPAQWTPHENLRDKGRREAMEILTGIARTGTGKKDDTIIDIN